MRLETERLLLRLPGERDLDALARMHADEAHMRYMGGPLDRETTWRHIAMIPGHWQIRGYGLFAVEDGRNGTFLERPWSETRIKDMDVVIHRLERPDWTGRGR